MENKTGRIFYFDALRAFAILSVVLLHVTCHLKEIMNYTASSIHSASGAFVVLFINFFTIGVPIFLLLSGALLLGRDWEIKDFLSKRLPRIAKPFLFWSLAFTVLLVILSLLIPSVDFVTSFGAYDILKLFWDTLMCNAPGSAVYWFFWMMFGVYLIIPIFNKWIKNSDLSELEYFLVLWLVSIVFEYTFMMECPVKLSYFTSPIGLVVLGYYLRHTDRKIFNNAFCAVSLIIISTVLMFVYSYFIADTVSFSYHRYSMPVVIEAIGVFCLFKCILLLNNPNEWILKIITSISVCSYGMYLIHSQLVMATRKLLHGSLGFTAEYLLLFVVGFIVSWLIIYTLSKIPVLKDFVGV